MRVKPYPGLPLFPRSHIVERRFFSTDALTPKTEISKSPVSKVPAELAKHEAAQHKVSKEMKRKRDAEDVG